MSKAIPEGLTKQHVLAALTDLDSNVAHPFGAPTGYQLVHNGIRYAPKAVIGLAFKHLTGTMLGPEEFSGELDKGVTLFWYDTERKAIVWRSKVIQVERFEYADKAEVRDRFAIDFGIAHLNDLYFDKAPDKGYCLAYRVGSLTQLEVPKPVGLRFPMEGWLRCIDGEAAAWLPNEWRIRYGNLTAALRTQS